MGFFDFIPKVIKSVFLPGSMATAVSAPMPQEQVKSGLKEESSMMQANLDAMRKMQTESNNSIAQLNASHREMMTKRDEAAARQEKKLLDDAALLKKESDEKISKLAADATKEREDARKEYIQLQERKDKELAVFLEKERKEKRDAQLAFEEKEKELHLIATTLTERLLEQEQQHSSIILELTTKHGVELKTLYEQRIEDQREFRVTLEGVRCQQIEDAKMNMRTQIALVSAHYETDHNKNFVLEMNKFNGHFLEVKSSHTDSLMMELATASEVDKDEWIACTRRLKESLGSLGIHIAKLETAKTDVIAALDKATSIPMETKREIKKALVVLSKDLLVYNTCSKCMLGKLSVAKPKRIKDEEVEKLSEGFMRLSSSVDDIPPFENIDYVAQIVRGQAALCGAFPNQEVPALTDE